MFIKDLKDCAEFVAGDGTILRELLHPDKAPLDLRYSLAHAILKPGQVSKPHCLRTSEVYYIVEGEGLMHINDETSAVGPGQAIYIPPNAVQHLDNKGNKDIVFICIVDLHGGKRMKRCCNLDVIWRILSYRCSLRNAA